MKGTDYKSLDLAQLREVLSEPQPTLILFHVHPDGDAVGSAFALSLWLQHKGSRLCILWILKYMK